MVVRFYCPICGGLTPPKLQKEERELIIAPGELTFTCKGCKKKFVIFVDIEEWEEEEA